MFKYDPKVLGTSIDYRHLTNIPGMSFRLFFECFYNWFVEGVWPGDPSTFGVLNYLKTGHLIDRALQISSEDDVKEALHVQAILSSFSWLNGQANHLGKL